MQTEWAAAHSEERTWSASEQADATRKAADYALVFWTTTELKFEKRTIHGTPFASVLVLGLDALSVPKMLEDAFGVEAARYAGPIKRYSELYTDAIIADWLCAHDVDGFIAPPLTRKVGGGLFHEEVCVCRSAAHKIRFVSETSVSNDAEENDRFFLQDVETQRTNSNP